MRFRFWLLVLLVLLGVLVSVCPARGFENYGGGLVDSDLLVRWTLNESSGIVTDSGFYRSYDLDLMLGDVKRGLPGFVNWSNDSAAGDSGDAFKGVVLDAKFLDAVKNVSSFYFLANLTNATNYFMGSLEDAKNLFSLQSIGLVGGVLQFEVFYNVQGGSDCQVVWNLSGGVDVSEVNSFVFVYAKNSSWGSFFVNGVAQLQNSFTGSCENPIEEGSPDSLFLFARKNGAFSDFLQLDEVLFFNRSLSVAELSLLGDPGLALQPEPYSPVNGTIFSDLVTGGVNLSVLNVSGNGSGVVVYDFEVSNDSGFGDLYFSSYGVSEGDGSTNVTVFFEDLDFYFWRVRAFDDGLGVSGPWSDPRAVNVSWSLDTGLQDNFDGSFRLFGLPSVAGNVTDVNFSLVYPNGSQVDFVGVSDGVTWNVSSLLWAGEGLYVWNVSGFNDSHLRGFNFSSYSANFTSFVINFSLDNPTNPDDIGAGCHYDVEGVPKDGWAWTAYDDVSGGLTNFSFRGQAVVFKAFGPGIAYNQSLDIMGVYVANVTVCLISDDTPGYCGGSCYPSPTDYNLSLFGEVWADTENGTHSTRTVIVDSARGYSGFDLFLLPSNVSSLVLVTVQDKSELALSGYKVVVEEFDVVSNSYSTVALGVTNDNGQDLINLVLYDVWYRFSVYDPSGVLVYFGGKTKLTGTSLVITVVPETVTEVIAGFGDVRADLSWVNESGSFRLEFESAVVRDYCLVVYRRFGQLETLCDLCQSDMGGVLVCDLNTSDPGTYWANAVVDIGDVRKVVRVVYHVVEEVGESDLARTLGLDGVLAALILMGSFTFAFLWNPVVASVALLIGLGSSVLLGLIAVSWLPGMLVLALMIGVVCYKVRA